MSMAKLLSAVKGWFVGRSSIPMSETWKDLNDDVILSLATMCPVDRVTRFKVVAKDYNSIISNSGFQKCYFETHCSQPQLLLTDRLIRVGTKAELFNPWDCTNLIVDVPYSIGSESTIIGCHKGLTAIWEKKKEVGNPPLNLFKSCNHVFRLWNPWIREDFVVKLKTDDKDITYQGTPISGLACDDSSDTYQFIIAFNKQQDPELIHILILSFRSGNVLQKQQVGMTLPPFLLSSGKTVKGFPHWACRDPGKIYRFNHMTLRFEKMDPPNQMGVHLVEGIGTLEDDLSVVTRSIANATYVVWVQNTYWISGWTKLYTLPLFAVQTGGICPIVSIERRSFYGVSAQRLILFDGGREVGPRWVSPWKWLQCISCQRTLVSPISLTELQ